MENKTDNTLRGFHIKNRNGDMLKLNFKKYTWHIPKALRYLHIQPGDIVAVIGVGGQKSPVLVTEVFREEIENVGKKYKPVKALYDRAKKE